MGSSEEPEVEAPKNVFNDPFLNLRELFGLAEDDVNSAKASTTSDGTTTPNSIYESDVEATPMATSNPENKAEGAFSITHEEEQSKEKELDQTTDETMPPSVAVPVVSVAKKLTKHVFRRGTLQHQEFVDLVKKHDLWKLDRLPLEKKLPQEIRKFQSKTYFTRMQLKRKFHTVKIQIREEEAKMRKEKESIPIKPQLDPNPEPLKLSTGVGQDAPNPYLAPLFGSQLNLRDEVHPVARDPLFVSQLPPLIPTQSMEWLLQRTRAANGIASLRNSLGTALLAAGPMLNSSTADNSECFYHGEGSVLPPPTLKTMATSDLAEFLSSTIPLTEASGDEALEPLPLAWNHPPPHPLARRASNAAYNGSKPNTPQLNLVNSGDHNRALLDNLLKLQEARNNLSCWSLGYGLGPLGMGSFGTLPFSLADHIQDLNFNCGQQLEGSLAPGGLMMGNDHANTTPNHDGGSWESPPTLKRSEEGGQLLASPSEQQQGQAHHSSFTEPPMTTSS